MRAPAASASRAGGLGISLLSSITDLAARLHNPLKEQLVVDPQNDALFPNRKSRESFGHYVEVQPDPLPEPCLVAFSTQMARSLDLAPELCTTDEFACFFSGDSSSVQGSCVRGWATPYAVSVFGQPIPAPDPFGRGNGYGDGRAVSLGELVASDGLRWELQLKGAGTTPFSRGGDGRAVLRSSVREFLVSEAMHSLGVPTTRALSLVASRSQFVRRMWYDPDDRGRDHPPDTVISERCAITCRVAPSFLRVGHIELHSRRMIRPSGPGEPTADEAKEQLVALLKHAIDREFVNEVDTSLPLPQQCVQLVREFAKRQASLAVNWLRVGYVQGNMNSDNCLLSGRTMDYGPFGFVEEYEALWSPFTSDMERKFGFERQPVAAQVNVLTFAQSLVPLIDGEEGGDEALAEMQKIVKDEYKEIVEAKLGEMRRAKLGIHEWDEQANSELWPKLQSLMQRSKVDYTILFRQLSSMTKHELSMGFDDLFSRLDPAFYCAETQRELASEWRSWFELYSQRVLSDTRDDETRRDEMRKTSPKYIPREWMLVGAYEAAERGDYGKIEELALIFETPFDEHPEFESKYYCRTPEEFRKKAGVSFFS